MGNPLSYLDNLLPKYMPIVMNPARIGLARATENPRNAMVCDAPYL